MIQAAARGRLARIIALKLKSAKKKLTKFIYSRVLRGRFRSLVMQMIDKVKQAVKKIQTARRRILRVRRVIVEINKRIAFKNRMAYEKEQERLRKIAEE